MDHNELEKALDRNAEIVLCSFFAMLNVSITTYALIFSTQAKTTITQPIYQYQILVNQQLLTAIVLFSSIVLFLAAIEAGKRLRKSREK